MTQLSGNSELLLSDFVSGCIVCCDYTFDCISGAANVLCRISNNKNVLILIIIGLGSRTFLLRAFASD